MNISKRLLAVAKLVPPKANVIDIGCDHALLDIYLINNKIINSVIVSDISKKALEQAKMNIKKYNLENKISTNVGNGLNNIDIKNIDAVIISGLGGATMANILCEDKNKLINIKNIILQPNNNAYYLRKMIVKAGYYIVDESLVKENNIIYPTILFSKGKKIYSKNDLFFGPILIKSKNQLFIEMFKNELAKKILVYNQIPIKHMLKKIIFKLEILNIKRIIKREK
jgi:tRNA (adenine22-N1)-methyltransferase